MVGREEEAEQPSVDDGLSVTSFIPFPNNKPFINSHLELKNPKSKAFPQSNRDAILDALKKMQSKLKKIEQDTSSGNSNVYAAYPINYTEAKNSETLFTPSSDQIHPEPHHLVLDRPISCCLSYHLKNIEQISEKTMSTESRVNELERQLEKMKKILNQVKEEPESSQSKKKSKIFPNDLSNCESVVIRPKRSKTKSPERNCMVRSRSAHVQRSNNQKVEIPFVVGKSVNPSHNLGVNIQNIRSLFKICSPKKFQTVNSGEASQVRNRSRSNGSRNQNLNSEKNFAENELDLEVDKNNSNVEIVSLDSLYSNDSSASASQIDFDELLCILQEEYTKLVLHQYEKTKQIMNCEDYELRSEIERQVDLLKKKIRIKTRQIEKVKKYQKNQR
ncbi:Centrosomal of 57, partial [Brachionus plicatilis]